MKRPGRPVSILVVEDAPEDRLLIQEALRENHSSIPVVFVADGVELFECLRQQGRYAASAAGRHPGLILLDLNLPVLDGWTVLQELKADARFRHIPVVVLTVSQAEEDLICAYNLNVAGVIVKPQTFRELTAIVGTLIRYWFEIVELPR
jgi:CheY-like chemotaxis protein